MSIDRGDNEPATATAERHAPLARAADPTTARFPPLQQPRPGLPPIVERLERGEQPPVCVIVVGMAGSGKSTLVTQLQRSLEEGNARQQEPPLDGATTGRTDSSLRESNGIAKVSLESTESTRYASYCVNLDPAALQVPYDVSIDIRDTVNYQQVMREHELGPNGAIMTCLNLFTTKFDQALAILERRAYGESEPELASATAMTTDDAAAAEASVEALAPTNTPPSAMDYILVDTPGQIEAFTWSASGSIIGESLASAFPTVLCFVVDTVRCASSPNTFMSNMLYAASMLYRTRLPLVVCFNKIDVVPHNFCLEWMRDYETFQDALDSVADSAGFYGSLTRSLSLVLDEFYSNFANAVGVSAITGAGMTEFWATVQKAASQDFALDYVQDLKNRMEEQQARQAALARISARRLQRDVADAGADDNSDE